MKSRGRQAIPQNKAAADAARANATFVEIFNRGMELHKAGRLDEAVAAFRKALSLSPNHPVACNNLATALSAQGHLEEALTLYRKAIAADPSMAFAYSNLSDTLTKLGRYDEALATAIRATVLDPQSADAFNNVSSGLLEVGRFDEAMIAVEKALALRPDMAFGHSNLGNALWSLGRLDEAIAAFARAIELAPDLAVGHKNLGLALLQKGEYRTGWPEYGWRWKADNRAPRDYAKPLWQGEPLSGKTLLLYTEQGLGDAIQFLRFVPHLAAPDVRIVLEVHPQLMGLARSVEGVAEIMPAWGKTPDFDVFLPIMDVPGVLGLMPDTLPRKAPYLAAEPERVAKWRDIIGAHGFRIGIVWKGYDGTPRKRLRFAPLEAFAPFAAIEGVRLISLQKLAPGGPDDAVMDRLGIETLGPDFDEGPDAFLDTAAVMENLDLVISIDTSVAHLAGALARPVWIALLKVPDWRWRLEGEDCIWYPTAKLFRQTKAGDWTPVFAQMADRLRERVAGAQLLPAPANFPRHHGRKAVKTQQHDHARLAAFIDGHGWDAIPELAQEPHISITRTTIASLLEQGILLPGMRLLDVGCGDGLALELFGQAGLAATGIAGRADSHTCQGKGLNVLAMDQNFMNFADASFDVLWCRQVLQRSVAPLFTLMEYRRVTKPGGFIHIDVPATGTDFNHETNPHYYSVMPVAAWQALFARAQLTVEQSFAIGNKSDGRSDAFWSFRLRRQR